MKHGKSYSRMGKSGSHRIAMLNNILLSIIQHGKIVTTISKVKGARPYIEKIITDAKHVGENISKRRQLLSKVKSTQVVNLLLSLVKDKFVHRNGGYLRIVRLGFRQGDRAEVALLEMVE